jgi:hypothetical protein
MRIRKKKSKQAGFTVIELLVASAVTLLLVGLMLQVTSAVLGSYDKIHGKLSANNDVLHALNTLVADLEGMIYRNDGNVWLAAEMVDSRFNTERAGDENLWKSPTFPTRQKPQGIDLDNDQYGQNGVWLRFLTSAYDRDKEDPSSNPIYGNINAVAYQILRRGASVKGEAESSASRSYGLYRTVVNADKTFEVGYDLDAFLQTNDYWTGLNTNLLGEPVEVLRPGLGSLIANNIIEFGIRFLDENNVDYVDFETVTVDPFFTGSGSRPLPEAYFAPYSTEPNRSMPEFADIYLRVLTEEGARLILRFEQGLYRADLTSTNERNQFWRELETNHSVEFRKRVQLREVGL